MIDKADIGWLAGILDGEGCICGSWKNRTAGKGNVTVEIRVESTSFAMIAKVASIYDDLGVRFAMSGDRVLKTSPTKRKAYRIGVYRQQELLKLLTAVLPHLVVKQKEAELVMGFLQKYGDQRSSAVEQRAPFDQKVVFFNTLRKLKDA